MEAHSQNLPYSAIVIKLQGNSQHQVFHKRHLKAFIKSVQNRRSPLREKAKYLDIPYRQFQYSNKLSQHIQVCTYICRPIYITYMPCREVQQDTVCVLVGL